MTPQQARALVPDALGSWAARDDTWAAWIDALPRRLAALCDEWQLRVDGATRHGSTAIVVPVVGPTRDVSGGDHAGPAVLKVGFVDEESEHEALALQRWGGRGAVRLLRADPRRGALLLERLAGPDLTETWDVEACEVVAGLYGVLHTPAAPQLRGVPELVGRWLDDLERLPRTAPLPRRLVEQTLGLGRALVDDPGSVGRTVHGDLHDENVLARTPGEWVAIDPKPMSGDPHYEPAPMLWNRWDEVVASGDVRDAVRRRFHTLVDTAGLDEDRVRDWVVVRTVVNASWEVRAAIAAERAPDRAWLTRCIAVAKAVQD